MTDPPVNPPAPRDEGLPDAPVSEHLSDSLVAARICVELASNSDLADERAEALRLAMRNIREAEAGLRLLDRGPRAATERHLASGSASDERGEG